MIVFTRAGRGAALTAPPARVALPVHAHQRYGHELLPPLTEPGTCAIDPGPFCGPADAAVIAPGDARGTALIPGRYGGYWLGLTGCEVRRDDPRPRVPCAPFRTDWHLFRDAPARLPDTG